MTARRTFLKGIGAGSLAWGISQADLTTAMRSGVTPSVLAAPVPQGPRASISQQPGQWSCDFHLHTNKPLDHQPWYTPLEALSWYATHGAFHAAAVTDLMRHTPTHGVAAVLNDPGRFLVVQGCEPSAEPAGVGVRIEDTLGLFLTGDGFSWDPDTMAGKTTRQVLDAEAAAIGAAGGIRVVAHPTMAEPLAPKAIAESDRDQPARILEICNPEEGSRWYGGGGIPSAEEVWDKVLDLGRVCWGFAGSDAHHYEEQEKSRQPNRHLATPGRAWIQVLADELTDAALRRAILGGRFYATFGSMGVVLLGYEASPAGVRLTLDPRTTDLGWSTGDHDRRGYDTFWIGDAGKVLKVDTGYTPSFEFSGTRTSRVRARLIDTNGNIAWTQPTFRR